MMLAESLRSMATDLKKHRQSQPCSAQTIVITGASSGIGLHAAKLFAVINPMNRIILVARDPEKAKRAREEVLAVLPGGNHKNNKYSENIISMACDHCRLASVRLFVSKLRRTLNESYSEDNWAFNGIDVLCLNAAILQPKDSRPEYTEDELEVTFQTNHLAPFLIANLTHDLVNPMSGRIILATSGLHCNIQLCLDGLVVTDTETGQVRKPFDMIDGSEFHFKRSYALSKLCVVAFCAELHQRSCGANNNNNSNNGSSSNHDGGIRVNCFSPGLMTGSGLFRHQPEVVGGAAPHVNNKNALFNEKSVEWGAGALVYMCLSDEAGKRGCEYWSDADCTDSSMGSMAKYGSDFRPTPISDKVVDAETRELLWRVSYQLAGLNEQDGE